MTKVTGWIRLFRINEWVKNGFVLLPLVFSGQLFNIHADARLFVTLMLFCFAASAVYIFNDIHDVEQDRLHPKKSKRPIASRSISVSAAWKACVIIVTFVVAIAFTFDSVIGYLLVTYLVVNVFYTYILKHISVVDVFAVTSGFVIRLVAGAESIQVNLSEWIVIMTVVLSLFLALSKRRSDVLTYLKDGTRRRKSVDGYTLEFLNASIAVLASVCIVAYLMYTISGETISRLGSQYVYLTFIFVLLGIIRYLQALFEVEESSPVEIFYNDRVIQLSIVAWLATLGAFIYLV